MTDYTAGTGTSGVLIIRDTGSVVQAIVQCNNGSTFVNGAAWTVSLTSGGSASGTFNISGVQEVVVWEGTIGTTLNMSFTMGSTGTSGLGGPTTVSATINRATVPSVVRSLAIDTVTPTSFRVTFTAPASNGGAGITAYLIRVSKNNPPNVSPYDDHIGNSGTVITGRTPGTQYYVTVYAQNSVGYSVLAPPVGVRTLGQAWVKINGVWKSAAPYVKIGGVWKLAVPYVKKGGVWKPTS